ncbi:acetyl-CoA carboxylase biotin carboxyl carrier protein [Arthrobacter sp. NPDC080073]|uniref:acetyl-CoA carboxylase biotin carboxyl carrier protein n=1 Tax=Arthrobacter sp. NPDC080073 TaxID=3155919 RepID=UPI00343ABCAD
MADNLPDMKELKAIVDWVNLAEDVRELSLKVGDVELHVSRNSGAGVGLRAAAVPVDGPAVSAPAASAPAVPAQEPAAVAPAQEPAAVAPAPDAPKDAARLADDEVLITAPMLGTFYASPQPGSPAFVSVGDRVQPDSVLGIVEVMKLMNNIEARVEGAVVRILAENESLVEYGQPLMVIRKDAS